METPKRKLWTLWLRSHPHLDMEMMAQFRSAAKLLDRPESQLAREAFREKLQRLAAEDPRISELLTAPQPATN